MRLSKYVKLLETEMKLDGDEYYRNAGNWSVKYKIIDGKLLSWHWNQGHNWLHRIELIPITKKEWEKGNRRYIRCI